MEPTSISQDYYDTLIRLVETFPTEAGSLIDANGATPVPGSRAYRETEESTDRAAIRVPLSLGAQALEHAGDHMWALARACTDPVLPFAAFTLARGVLESAATAVWVFDPNIDGQERAARGMSARKEALDGQRRFVESTRAAGHSVDEGIEQFFPQRIEEILAEAAQSGVEPHRDRRGRLDGFGSRMPRRIELAGAMLDGETDYRLFSAVAHGEPWALLGVGFKATDGGEFATKHAEPVVLAYLCHRSIEYFSRALWDQAYLYGWKSGPFARLLEETYDSLHLRSERRFWRSQVVDHA